MGSIIHLNIIYSVIAVVEKVAEVKIASWS